MTGYEPTRGDLARDQATLNVAMAYTRLSSEVRGQLIAYLAGPRNPAAALDVAQLVVGATCSEDLALVLARLLVAAGADEAMEVMVTPVPASPAGAMQRRRSSDAVEG